MQMSRIATRKRWEEGEGEEEEEAEEWEEGPKGQATLKHSGGRGPRECEVEGWWGGRWLGRVVLPNLPILPSQTQVGGGLGGWWRHHCLSRGAVTFSHFL